MNYGKQIKVNFLCLLFFCNCSSENVVEEKPQGSKSLVEITHQDTLKESHEDEEIIRLVMNLDEVEKANAHIDSISNHQNGVAIISDGVDESTGDYNVRVGYNSEERFEVYYFFSINPKTFQVKIMDVANDTVIAIEDWRKMKTQEN